MRLYLVGPMTGIQDFNFPLFLYVAAALRSQGFEVVSPAEMDIADRAVVWGGGRFQATHPYEYCLMRGERAAQAAEGLVLLSGYRQSNGAQREIRAYFGTYRPVTAIGLWEPERNAMGVRWLTVKEVRQEVYPNA